MKQFEIINPYSPIIDRVYPELCNYSNGRLAIRLNDCGDNCPYAVMTVNLPDAPIDLAENEAFVDVNNFPQAESMIRRYGLGEYIGKWVSGFVAYPLYRFDLSKFE